MSEFQESVLEVIRNEPNGIKQREIIRLLGIHRNYVSSACRSLERSGIIERERENGQNRWKARPL